MQYDIENWEEENLDIILASASTRRRYILDIFDIDYTIKVPSIDEIINGNFSPEINVMHIAYLKARNILEDNPNAIVISADTVVALEDKIFGKPKNSEDAFDIISELSGKKHSVITGFCLASAEKNIVYTDYVKTDVVFRKLSNDIISNYLKTNEYLDKAGGYGIQGKASLFVDKIEGDYFNVVGFPIAEINKVLIEKFDFSLI